MNGTLVRTYMATATRNITVIKIGVGSVEIHKGDVLQIVEDSYGNTYVGQINKTFYNVGTKGDHNDIHLNSNCFEEVSEHEHTHEYDAGDVTHNHPHVHEEGEPDNHNGHDDLEVTE